MKTDKKFPPEYISDAMNIVYWGEWNPNKSIPTSCSENYKAIVRYKGDLYISRKYAADISPDNKEYWRKMIFNRVDNIPHISYDNTEDIKRIQNRRKHSDR